MTTHPVSYPSIKTFVLGTQKNRLIEMLLLSSHNICFGGEVRKSILDYALLSEGLTSVFSYYDKHPGDAPILIPLCDWGPEIPLK